LLNKGRKIYWINNGWSDKSQKKKISNTTIDLRGTQTHFFSISFIHMEKRFQNNCQKKKKKERKKKRKITLLVADKSNEFHKAYKVIFQPNNE